jgi:hypothetical protein
MNAKELQRELAKLGASFMTIRVEAGISPCI